MAEEETLTPEEDKAIKEYLGSGVPLPEDKQNVYSFLYAVATSDDTTKLGNLSEEELGTLKLTLRGAKNCALIADKIIGNDTIASYFAAEGEIITSTSLSKNAKLLNSAIMQKRIIEDQTKKPKPNKGWFKKKEGEEQQNEQI